MEGLDEIEENSKNAAIAAAMDAHAATKAGGSGGGGVRPPTDAELRTSAVRAAKDREQIEKQMKEKIRKTKLRRRRGLYSCCCFPVLVITFIKTSFRDTRESFVLAVVTLISSSCKTIPLSAMFCWLSFATPRGMTDLIMLTLLLEFVSIVLSVIMWERSALRTEQNIIVSGC